MLLISNKAVWYKTQTALVIIHVKLPDFKNRGFYAKTVFLSFIN
ncbi:hypothetical protein NU09_1518 [Flavobacterium beibuense]|uniref:Uncharacterized protein n=1 Tax=Flavobacterium beibuense TaxID=657326 RepID=A0A444WBI3_9FLAO|nr:hypothetical protein NU09_1518 [Flavobacterium beibuense]